jgi:pimeloyl-ACP methyl ester carboxylesterase
VPTTSANGVRIAYTVRGRGPTAVFLSGIGQRAVDWNEALLDQASTRYQVVSIDNRGIGDSDSAEDPCTLEQMADDAVAVLDALGQARAHVIGHSMGGMIAQHVAFRHPARVDHLVLVCSHGGGPEVVGPTPAAAAVLFGANPTLPPGEITRQAMVTITAPGFAERVPQALATLVANATVRPTSAVAFVRQMQAILASERHLHLREIDAPTLVVHGIEDSLIPVANGRTLATAIPGATLTEIADCGHMPMWECPERLLAILLAFLPVPRPG